MQPISTRCPAAARISRRPTPRSRQSSSTYSVSTSPSASRLAGDLCMPGAAGGGEADDPRSAASRDIHARGGRNRHAGAAADGRVVECRLPGHRHLGEKGIGQNAGIGAAPCRDMDRTDGDRVGHTGLAQRNHACRSRTAAKNPSVPCLAGVSDRKSPLFGGGWSSGQARASGTTAKSAWRSRKLVT